MELIYSYPPTSKKINNIIAFFLLFVILGFPVSYTIFLRTGKYLENNNFRNIFNQFNLTFLLALILLFSVIGMFIFLPFYLILSSIFGKTAVYQNLPDNTIEFHYREVFKTKKKKYTLGDIEEIIQYFRDASDGTTIYSYLNLSNNKLTKLPSIPELIEWMQVFYGWEIKKGRRSINFGFYD